MTMLEINLREPVDGLLSVLNTRYRTIVEMGITRDILIHLLKQAVIFHVDSKQCWVAGSRNEDVWDTTIFITKLLSILSITSTEATTMLKWVVTLDDCQVEKEYGLLGKAWDQVIHEICELVAILLPKRTWDIVDVKPVGERVFLVVGEDYRVAQYERLQACERVLKDLLHITLNEDIRVIDREPLQAVEIAFDQLTMHDVGNNKKAVKTLLDAFKRFTINRDKL